jgi:sugar phosphate isomerase/epimerase
MQNNLDRRGFLKATGAAGLGLGCAALHANSLWAAGAPKGAPHAAKLGWCLACTTYSFNPFTFYKTLDVVGDLGLDSVEGFSWQPLSDEKPAVQTNHGMSAADRKEAKTRLTDKGMKLVGCYYNLPEGDACRAMFEWAKEMGIEYLVAEPSFDAYDALDKLCQEYKVNLAIHNHPKPNPYWNPDVLIEHLRGHSQRMGACCDTGHWVRSGLDPVEMLKKLQGHIVSFHLKDIPAVGEVESPCVPFGTGRGDVEGILRECRRQGFRGVFGIEYEPYSPESPARVAECIANFEKMGASLG